MTNQVTGEIDISPPLQWSEVQPTGFMVMNNKGVPKVPAGQMVELDAVEEMVARPEGTLFRYTFPRLVAVSPDVGDQEGFRAQVAAIIATFPTHTFGGVSRVIRFRGDQIDDQWRVGLAADGITVRRQTATLTWVDV